MNNKYFGDEEIATLNKALVENDYETFFDECGFKQYGDDDDEDIELETWTDGGYDEVFDINRENWKEAFIRYAREEFDPSHEVEIWWGNASYRSNYSNSMREAIEDQEKHQDWLKAIADIIEANGKYAITTNEELTGQIVGFAKSLYIKSMLDVATDKRLYEMYLEDDENTVLYSSAEVLLNEMNDGAINPKNYYFYQLK